MSLPVVAATLVSAVMRTRRAALPGQMGRSVAGANVGTFNVRIEIGDPEGQTFEEVEALVDTGATMTAAPESTLQRLGVVPSRRSTFRLANGDRVDMDMGETKVRVQGLETTTWVIFGQEGTATVLGAMTLEELLLGVGPVNRRLIAVEGLLMSNPRE